MRRRPAINGQLNTPTAPTNGLIIVGTPCLSPWIFWPAVLSGLGFAGWGFHVGLPWYWMVPVELIVLLVICAFTRQVVVDGGQREVFESERLFMRKVLWERTCPLTDFDAVVYDRGGEEVSVGLRHRSGRCVWIRDFASADGHPPRAAQEFAWRLTCDTGIEVDEQTA